MQTKVSLTLTQCFGQARTRAKAIWPVNKNSRLRQRLAANATWSLTSSIIARGTGLIASIVVARILGVTEFGELGLIRSTVITLGVLSGYGIGLSATKFVAEAQETDTARAGRLIVLTLVFTLLTSLLAAVIMWAGAIWIARYLSLAPSSVGYIRLAAPLLVANAVWSVLQATLVGFQGFRELAVNNAIYGVLALVLTVILTYLFGLSGNLIALCLGAVVGALLAGRVVLVFCRRRSISLTVRIQQSDINDLWRFGLPAYVSGIIVMPVLWWAYAQIASSPGGTAKMGLFNAADQWRTMILFVPQALALVALPMLTDAHAQRNQRDFQRVLLINVIAVAGLGLVMLAVFYLLRHIILSAYGQDFLGAADVLMILVVTGVVQSIGTIIGQSMFSLSKMRWAVMQNAAWATALFIGLTYIFELSAQGLAGSILVAYIVMTVISCIFVYYYVIRGKDSIVALVTNQSKNPGATSTTNEGNP